MPDVSNLLFSSALFWAALPQQGNFIRKRLEICERARELNSARDVSFGASLSLNQSMHVGAQIEIVCQGLAACTQPYGLPFRSYTMLADLWAHSRESPLGYNQDRKDRSGRVYAVKWSDSCHE